MAENRVQFGLKNFHYAVITEAANGMITYSTPTKVPGMVTLSLEVKGETSDFYADDIIYFTTSSNQGYDGTVEFAKLTEAFRTEVLGETLDPTSKVLIEKADAKPKKIACMFEFDGDVKATRRLLTYCTVNRPGLASETKTESSEPGTVELSFVASPRPTDNVVKIETGSETTEAVYNSWYTTVFAPTTTPTT